MNLQMENPIDFQIVHIDGVVIHSGFDVSIQSFGTGICFENDQLLICCHEEWDPDGFIQTIIEMRIQEQFGDSVSQISIRVF
mgnify:CR=1 FL=1